MRRFRLLSAVVGFGIGALANVPPGAAQNALPPQAVQALAQPSSVELFSLEPWAMPGGPSERFHDRSVLGSTDLSVADGLKAAHALSTAVAGWDGIDAGCFDPRQALRVRSPQGTFDFLVSYQCHNLEVYQNNKLLVRIGIFGDSRELTDLLDAEKIPLSRSGQFSAH